MAEHYIDESLMTTASVSLQLKIPGLLKWNERLV